MEYNWVELLPTEVVEQRNQYENLNYQKLYFNIKQKKYFSITIYFLKKKIYQRIKQRRGLRREN